VKLFLKLIIVFFLLSSCVNLKYIYFIDKNNSLEVSNEKWILNKPYSNQDIIHIEDIALQGFSSIFLGLFIWNGQFEK
jgi:TRAP-type mannitol/chloroaromatic compound transport system permease small subunit